MSQFDVTIIGGGIIGLTLAVQGVRLGQKVLLLESNHLGFGASGAGSGILMTHGARQFHSLFREMYVRSVKEYYPQWVEFLNESLPSHEEELKIRTTGSWQFYSQERKFEQLQAQLEREASVGFETLSKLPKEFEDLLQADVLTQGVHFPEESIIHNSQLLSHLHRYLRSSSLFELCQGAEPQLQWQKSTESWAIQMGEDTRKFESQSIILSAGAWCDGVLNQLGLESRMTPVRGQLAWYEHPEIELETSIHMDGHFYAIPREGGFILGATTEAREWDQSFVASGQEFLDQNIAKYLHSDYHQLQPQKAWAGLRPRSRDRKPLMGVVDSDRKVWMSAGHYKNGLSMAPLAAEVLWQMILGEKPILDLQEFDPHRTKGLLSL